MALDEVGIARGIVSTVFAATLLAGEPGTAPSHPSAAAEAPPH